MNETHTCLVNDNRFLGILRTVLLHQAYLQSKYIYKSIFPNVNFRHFKQTSVDMKKNLNSILNHSHLRLYIVISKGNVYIFVKLLLVTCYLEQFFALNLFVIETFIKPLGTNANLKDL